MALWAGFWPFGPAWLRPWSAFEPIWSLRSTKNTQLVHSLIKPFEVPGTVGIGKKSRNRYRKNLVPKKVPVSVSFKILGTVTHWVGVKSPKRFSENTNSMFIWHIWPFLAYNFSWNFGEKKQVNFPESIFFNDFTFFSTLRTKVLDTYPCLEIHPIPSNPTQV